MSRAMCRLTTALAATMVAVMTAASMTASNASIHTLQGNEKTIVGVWQTLITPRNCQTGDPL